MIEYKELTGVREQLVSKEKLKESQKIYCIIIIIIIFIIIFIIKVWLIERNKILVGFCYYEPHYQQAAAHSQHCLCSAMCHILSGQNQVHVNYMIVKVQVHAWMFGPQHEKHVAGVKMWIGDFGFKW